MEHYLQILFLKILTIPLIPELLHTLENNGNPNQFAHQSFHRQLYQFLANSCRGIALHRTFIGGLIHGVK
jgi:hypothetical protein